MQNGNINLLIRVILERLSVEILLVPLFQCGVGVGDIDCQRPGSLKSALSPSLSSPSLPTTCTQVANLLGLEFGASGSHDVCLLRDGKDWRPDVFLEPPNPIMPKGSI